MLQMHNRPAKTTMTFSSTQAAADHIKRMIELFSAGDSEVLRRAYWALQDFERAPWHDGIWQDVAGERLNPETLARSQSEALDTVLLILHDYLRQVS